MFRRLRTKGNKACSTTVICKKCENVATLILSELQFQAREGNKLPRGSKEYQETCATLFLASGYTDVPRDADGQVCDLLKYQLRFCKEDGQPFVPSAARIRQIKIEGGYAPKEETICHKN